MDPAPVPPKRALRPGTAVTVFLSGWEDALLSVGMLHLHRLIETTPDCPVRAERAILDESLLAGTVPEGHPGLRTVESGRPLGEADALIFSISNPVLLPWMLSALEASGVPLLREDRRPGDPVVIVGNLATSNPEPLAPFCDLCLIGPAEDALLAVLGEIHRDGREAIARCAAFPGVYAPAAYRLHGPPGLARPVPVADAPGHISAADPAALRPSWSRHAAARILPDRLVISPTLGCRASCRFCLAGQAPLTEAPVRMLVDYIERARRAGAHRAVVHSLSLPQFSARPALSEALAGMDVTVGSMRADELGPLELSWLAKINPRRSLFAGSGREPRRRLVLAPETATEARMGMLGKRFTRAMLLERAQRALALGFESLMVYFLVGLPGEDARELDGIVDLVLALHSQGGWAVLDVKLMQLEAEPGTPLENVAVAAPGSVDLRIAHITQALTGLPGVRVHSDPTPHRRYRAFIKRGDRAVGRAALALHRAGIGPAQLTDGALRGALADQGVALDALLAERVGPHPWSHVAPTRRVALRRRALP